MTAIVSYHEMSDVSELAGILATYTCGTDGYVHAWQDTTNPLIVWVQATCPVDAVVTSMAATITSSVTTHKADSDLAAMDPCTAILTVEARVRADVNAYIATQTTTQVATFMARPAFLNPFIQDELETQSVITSV